MGKYIVCYHKRSRPRISVKVCVARCEMVGECEEFKKHLLEKNGR